MIWWVIGGYWAGFLRGMLAMSIFVAGINPTGNGAMEENEGSEAIPLRYP